MARQIWSGLVCSGLGVGCGLLACVCWLCWLDGWMEGGGGGLLLIDKELDKERERGGGRKM